MNTNCVSFNYELDAEMNDGDSAFKVGDVKWRVHNTLDRSWVDFKNDESFASFLKLNGYRVQNEDCPCSSLVFVD